MDTIWGQEDWDSTLDLSGAMASHAFVEEVLDFCFLGGGEGEGVAEVVFDFGAGWLLLVCHFGCLVCFSLGRFQDSTVCNSGAVRCGVRE